MVRVKAYTESDGRILIAGTSRERFQKEDKLALACYVSVEKQQDLSKDELANLIFSVKEKIVEKLSAGDGDRIPELGAVVIHPLEEFLS